MTLNPRNRNLVGTVPSATTRANKPPLIKPNTGDPALDRWCSAVTERLQLDDGSRGRPLEQTMTRRDMEQRLQDLGIVVQGSPGIPAMGKGIVVAGPDGRNSYMDFDAFAHSIYSTKLFRDLTASIDDLQRFDDLPDQTRALLMTSIADEAEKRGADIRRLDTKFQSATDSFAQTVTEVTASVAGAHAGVREVQFASASANRATAGIVTQVQARLNNFSGGAPGTATVESKMTAIADRATGLEAQYTLKVSAGGAAAGFGVAATTNVAGNATSAFIIQADKFAIVSSSYTGGLTNSPPANSLMFGVDVDGAYVKGNLKVSGKAYIDGSSTSTMGYSGAMHVNTSYGTSNGLWGYTNQPTGGAVNGDASNGGSAVYGQVAGGVLGAGTHGLATGAGKVGARAWGQSGAAGLDVRGAMTIDNSTLVTNLNAEMLGGNQASAFLLETGFTTGNPGTSFTHSVTVQVGVTTFRIPAFIP